MVYETGPPSDAAGLVEELENYRFRLMNEIETPRSDLIAKRVKKMFLAKLGAKVWLQVASEINGIFQRTLEGWTMDINLCFEEVQILLHSLPTTAGVQNESTRRRRRSA